MIQVKPHQVSLYLSLSLNLTDLYSPQGYTRLSSTKDGGNMILTWEKTDACNSLNSSDPAFSLLKNKEFCSAVSVIARSGDQLRYDSFAAFNYEDKVHIFLVFFQSVKILRADFCPRPTLAKSRKSLLSPRTPQKQLQLHCSYMTFFLSHTVFSVCQ